MLAIIPNAQLSAEERSIARSLWEQLVRSQTPSETHAARTLLAEAPSTIQQAIINEIAGALRRCEEPSSIPNPFPS